VFTSADEGANAQKFAVGVGKVGDGTLGDIRVLAKSSTTWQVAGTTDTLAVDTWYLLGYSSNGSAWQLTVNGVEQGITVITTSNSGKWLDDVSLRDNVTVGSIHANSAWASYTAGYITEVAYFSDQKTPAQILTYYNSGVPLNVVAESNLVGYWMMHEGTGTTLSDSVGSITFDFAAATNDPSWASELPMSSFYLDNTLGYNNHIGSQASPWKTLAKINSNYTPNAGESIYLKKGETWREQLTVPSSGTSGNPITFGNYGSGALPIINGSDLADGLTNVAGDKWYITGMSTEIDAVWFDNAWGTEVDSSELVNTEKEWAWTTVGDDTLTIFTSDTTVDIKYGQRDYAVLVDGDDYITVNGIHAQNVQGWPGAIAVNGASNNIIFQNCTASYNWSPGFRMGHSSSEVTEGRITNNISHHNIEGGILLNKYATNIRVDNNTCYQNGYFNSQHPNNLFTFGIKAWGDTTANYCKGIIIENNEVYNNGFSGGGIGQSVGIWFDEILNPDSSNVCRYNKVYDNYGMGIYIEKADSTRVYYNVLYDNAKNTSATLGYSAGIGLNSNYNLHANGNQIYNNSISGGLVGIKSTTGADNTPSINGNLFKNNISSGATSHEFYASGGGANNTTNGTGNVYTYNCFGAASDTFIYWYDTTISTYAVFDDSLGSASLSITVDPQYISTTNLKPKASALDKAGTYITSTFHARDYAGSNVSSPPDVGAYQFSLGYENRFPKWPNSWKFPRR
jgi:hypothetical protein